MKVYDLALFLFIMNVVLAILIQLNLGFETTMQPSEGKGNWQTYTEELKGELVGTNVQSSSSSNWFVDQIKLVLQAIPIFFKAFAYATVAFPLLLNQYFGTIWGLQPSEYTPIVAGISAVVYLIYAVAVIQFVSGRKVE